MKWQWFSNDSCTCPVSHSNCHCSELFLVQKSSTGSTFMWSISPFERTNRIPCDRFFLDCGAAVHNWEFATQLCTSVSQWPQLITVWPNVDKNSCAVKTVTQTVHSCVTVSTIQFCSALFQLSSTCGDTNHLNHNLNLIGWLDFSSVGLPKNST